MSDRDEIMSVWVEAGAEELYHQASQGKPWASAGRQIQEDFRGIVQRIIETAHGAELVYRSKREQEHRGVPP
jgi:hypothetical protein